MLNFKFKVLNTNILYLKFHYWKFQIKVLNFFFLRIIYRSLHSSTLLPRVLSPVSGRRDRRTGHHLPEKFYRWQLNDCLVYISATRLFTLVSPLWPLDLFLGFWLLHNPKDRLFFSSQGNSALCTTIFFAAFSWNAFLCYYFHTNLGIPKLWKNGSPFRHPQEYCSSIFVLLVFVL